MRWHHAYVNYAARSTGRKGETEHILKWWDTQKGEREMTIDKPEHFLRSVLDLASRDGWEFVAKDTHTIFFKKPAD